MTTARIAALTICLGLLTPAGAGAATRALRAPAPVSPAAGARVESIPALTWGAVRGASAYEYEIAADPGFGSILLGTGFAQGAARTDNTAASLSSAVPDGEYFWRVRAIGREDRAGRWSPARRLVKDWTSAPKLEAPSDGTAIKWPAEPIVLRWANVPFATKYVVTIATDPGLANPVLGLARDPVKTQGTTFAFPGTLAPGVYYWAITPVDADGHTGQRSAVQQFSWTWPTATTATVTDANPAASVYDPVFSWDPVAGAASYEVEVNTSSSFVSSSRVCCTDATTGTSLSPRDILRNNVYFWRMRAVDASGNAGDWNAGPSFQKDFDAVTPSIAGLHVRDRTRAGLPDAVPVVSSPILEWSPVTGASSYSVETVEYDTLTSTCPWGDVQSGNPQVPYHDDTAATVYAYGSGTPLVQGPVSASIASPSSNASGLVAGRKYCARVRARSDRASDDNGFVSGWTQINGAGQPAFEFDAPASPPYTGGGLPAPAYGAPTTGSLTPRLPLLTWSPVPGANGYWVIVARDTSFTTIADYAFTRFTQYTPGAGAGVDTYTDETSKYYWAVIPAPSGDGSGASGDPLTSNPQQFDKSSVPPAPTAPAMGADVPIQPTFRWGSSEGARRYRLQVAQDATFGNPIDDVVTASTAYTSSTTYPADTQLFWRVAGLDENHTIDRQPLNWSATGSFVRRLPVPAPAPGNPTGGSAIPVLAWSAVPGAISYDIRADWVDGRSSTVTTSSTAFTPIEFYGNGIWRWKARANFPTSRGNAVSGGYFPAQEFTRRMDRTPNVRGTKTPTRVVLSWDPDPAASSYRVEIARTTGFGRTIDQATTKTTSFSPDLARGSYADGGTLYWRVGSVDDGRNIGAWTTGTFVFPKGMTASVSGVARKGRRSTLTVIVRDAARKPVRGALVRIAGPGVRSTRHRADRDGAAPFSVRPRRRGTLTFTVTRKGYRDATATVPVG